MHNPPKTLLMVVNDAAFFLSHREPVAKAALDSGFRVIVATASSPAVHAIVDAGYEHRVIRLTRSGRNPFAEILSLVSLIRLFRSIRPDIVHLVTIKPVLYGGIAARMVGVPGVVSAISGLGTVFGSAHDSRMSITRFAAKLLYRLALGNRNQRVIFQNSNDRNVVSMLTGLHPDKAMMIPGSGVDLSEYKMADEAKTDVPVVVMAGRLLRDKGVYEFTEAARILKHKDVRARFLLVGDPDHTNSLSVNESQLALWREEGAVEILGFRSDIASIFAMSHIVVLPSYHEGIPKVLLEAAACGRPVVTTDIPGCREAIEPGQSGLLVPLRDAGALAEAIQRLVENEDLRRQMGRAGRILAEKKFGIEEVIAQHLSIYETLISDVQASGGKI